MKDYIIDCFDENIQKEIRVLNEKLKALSPENFKYFSTAVLDLNNKVDGLNFIYSGLNMVNGVDTYKLDKMLTNAKANVMEFSTRSIISIPGTDGTAIALADWTKSQMKDGKLLQLNMKVPNGFSGMNSFVFFNPPVEHRYEYAKDRKSKIWYYRTDREIRILVQARWLFEVHALFWR